MNPEIVCKINFPKQSHPFPIILCVCQEETALQRSIGLLEVVGECVVGPVVQAAVVQSEAPTKLASLVIGKHYKVDRGGKEPETLPFHFAQSSVSHGRCRRRAWTACSGSRPISVCRASSTCARWSGRGSRPCARRTGPEGASPRLTQMCPLRP